MNPLQYNRDRSLELLAKDLGGNASPTDLDRAIDAAIRAHHGMPPGPLYGFVSPQPQKILLDKIPFWKQTDNYRDGNRTCFSSTNAMQVRHHAPSKINSDDEYVRRVFQLGDTTDPAVQCKVIESYGLKPAYRQNMDFADIDRELERGNPIAVGILHRGPASNPTGGHWVLVVGRAADNEAYYCNDPYGSLGDGYQGAVENGHHVQYSKKMFRNRWTVEGAGSGWGLYIEP